MSFLGIQQLVERVRQGDEQAAWQIAVERRAYLVLLASKVPGIGDHTAEDLVQEVSTIIRQKIHTFQGGQDDEETDAKLKSWLATTIKLRGFNFHRDRRRGRVEPNGSPLQALSAEYGQRVEGRDGTGSTNARFSEEVRCVQLALEALADPIDREILQLYFFDSEGLSLAKIGERLDFSYDTIRKKYHEALDRFTVHYVLARKKCGLTTENDGNPMLRTSG